VACYDPVLRVDQDRVRKAEGLDAARDFGELLRCVSAAILGIGHQRPDRAHHDQACKLEFEDIVSKSADAAYAPGNRGLWLKVKCLYREEFVVVGWTDPEGRRPWLGALLLAYYDPDGRRVYAGRAGTGINTVELKRLWHRLQPLATDKMALDVPPPRGSRFGSPLVLSRVHWVRPELVAEVKYLTWTEDNLLRQVVYEGLREDEPAAEIRRSPPYPKPAAATGTGVPSRGATLRSRASTDF
jgi:ATP-dependent DNA ligase